MIIYKCDGHKFKGDIKCLSTYESFDGKNTPFRWITFDGSIINETLDAHTIQSGGLRHFCSRECLENFLFKNDMADRIRQGMKHLKMLHETIKKAENTDSEGECFEKLKQIAVELDEFYKPVE
jgi:hypothetical protein